MRPKRFYYLTKISYLGYRYWGWQRQKEGILTVQGAFEKSIRIALEDEEVYFKTMGSSRTDAKVSAFESYVMLHIEKELEIKEFTEKLRQVLPQDIELLDITPSYKEFQIIGNNKEKEYWYYFCSGDKPHPFCSPYMGWFQGELDIPLMQEGAKLFLGTHNYLNFSYKTGPQKKLDRTIFDISIEENTDFLQDKIFPKTYVFKVRGGGFLRFQVRIMIGTLANLGLGKTTLEDIKKALEHPLIKQKPGMVAPAQGLFLKSTKFTHE